MTSAEVSVSAAEIPALVQEVAAEQGIVIRCPCGGARFCPLSRAGLKAYQQFDRLHADCIRERRA